VNTDSWLMTSTINALFKHIWSGIAYRVPNHHIFQSILGTIFICMYQLEFQYLTLHLKALEIKMVNFPDKLMEYFNTSFFILSALCTLIYIFKSKKVISILRPKTLHPLVHLTHDCVKVPLLDLYPSEMASGAKT